MVINVKTAIATAALSLTLSPAWAQQAGHQMAGTAGGGVAMCAQNSEGVTRTIDVVNARIEDARQTNDAPTLRASIADLQSVFAQIKTQLAECVALSGEAGGTAMGSMPGMDHSKMQMPATPAGAKAAAPAAGMDHSKMTGNKAAAPAPGTSGDAAVVGFTVRTEPAPPRRGKNDFEIALMDAEGKPITDADVSLAFYMPPVPSMHMPEMRSAAQLISSGNGVYRGSGTVAMAGDWDVTITAARRGQTLGTKKMKLTAK